MSEAAARFTWRSAPRGFRSGLYTALVGWLLLGAFFPYDHNDPLLLGFTAGQALLLLGALIAGRRVRRGVVALLLLLGLVTSVVKGIVAMPSMLDNDVRSMLVFPAWGLLLFFTLYYAIRRAPGERRRRASRRPTGERIIEMTWVCLPCGHRNLGRHRSCRECGHPMGEDERYEMPENTAAAVTVTDEALLRMAEAGPNWRCAYCRSDQRALDGTCQECGASAPRSEDDAAPSRSPRPRAARSTFVLVLAVALGIAVVAGGAELLLHDPIVDWIEGKREVTATVREARWEHQVTVSRAIVLHGEGFAEKRPSDAFDVKVVERRFHHNEQVCAREGTETYTESVPDGTRSESYTERVQCGESCTSSSSSCSERCTSNRNGFATCRTVCSGGGRSCTPKYCDERRTREVPKFRNETRTRTVCKEHRQEPRDAEWLAWSYRGWRQEKQLRLSGDDSAPRWPTAEETKIDAPAAETSAARHGTYRVVLVTDAGERFVQAPKTEAAFRELPLGGRHRLHLRNNAIEIMTPEQPR
jgi:hypothetical protein